MRKPNRVLRKIRALLLLAAALCCLCGLQVSAASKTETVNITGSCNYSSAYSVLKLVNQERSAAGLSSLTMDKDLLNAAMQRAAETSVYFDHTRPSGDSCFTVSAKAYGENIAAGQTTASSVMNSWMNSSGHKANILGSGYTTIGIGCFKQNGMTFWVQLFGYGSATTLSQPSNSTKTFSVTLDASNFKLYLDSPDKSRLKAGKSYTFEATLRNPAIGTYVTVDNNSLKWSSSSSAATVSAKGVVTGVKKGSATIRASGENGNLSASKTLSITKNLSTSISGLSNTAKGIKISWKKSPSAKGYYIYRKSSGSYKKIKTIKSASTTSYTDKSVKNSNGSAYTYKVVAYSGSSTGSGATKKTVRLTGTKLSSVKNTASKKMTVKWKKASNISGYQIQYATNASFSGKKSKTVSASKNSQLISSLTKGKTYYVRIRTYKKSSGKKYYSAWSKTAKVNVKK